MAKVSVTKAWDIIEKIKEFVKSLDLDLKISLQRDMSTRKFIIIISLTDKK